MAEQKKPNYSRDDHKFIAQAISQNPDNLNQQYSDMFNAVDYGFGAPAGLGTDAMASGALQNKLKGQLNDRLSIIKNDLLRNRYGDFSRLSGRAGRVSDAEMDTLRLEEQIQIAKEAARKAKKRGMTSALLGTVGAVGGGIIGGPAGAAVGAGVGQSVGSTM